MATVQSYNYRAVAAGGNTIVKGTLDAAGEAGAAAKLKAQGLVPLEVVPTSKTGLNREIQLGSGKGRRVRLKPLALFSRQLANLINAGLPLLRALSIMIEQTENKPLKSALVDVKASVESGAAFSAALAKHPQAFPPLMVNLVRVGESGGFLGRSLDQIAGTYRSDAELQDKLKSASTYPLVVLGIAILGVTIMLTVVVPIFEQMFASLGGELPLPTQILVTISRNMVWIVPAVVALVVIAGVVWSRNRNSLTFRRLIDPFRLKMPIFGPLATKVAVARFSRSLAMMLQAGVPLMQALGTVGQASNNFAIEEAVRSIQKSIRDGRSFAAPLAAADVFPPMVAQMVSVGEESGTLADMLGNIAEIYEQEAKTATEQLASTLEPLLIVIVGVVIGGMVLALYMPIFGLYAQLGAQ